MPVSDQTPNVTLVNSSETEVGTAGAPLRVDPTGTTGQPVVGGAAVDVALSGNPVPVAGRASSATPTPVSSDGDVVVPWLARTGAIIPAQAPHVGLIGNPWTLLHEGAQYETTQTSTVLIDPGAGERIVVTQIQIQAYGTLTFELQVYFGTGAFSRGTSRAIFDGTFKPSGSSAPGVVMTGPFIAGANGDDLRVTATAPGGSPSVIVNIWYYVVS